MKNTDKIKIDTQMLIVALEDTSGMGEYHLNLKSGKIELISSGYLPEQQEIKEEIEDKYEKYRIGGYLRERVCPKCKKRIFFKDFFYNNFSLGIKLCRKAWNSYGINYKCWDCFFNKKDKNLKENSQYFEKKIQFLERTCFKCKEMLTFKDFYSINKAKGKKACEQMWNLPLLQFLCCYCYREELRSQLGMTPITISI